MYSTKEVINEVEESMMSGSKNVMEEGEVIMEEVDTGNNYEDNQVGEKLMGNGAVLVNSIIGDFDGDNLVQSNAIMREWNLVSSKVNGNVTAPIEDDRRTKELVARVSKS